MNLKYTNPILNLDFSDPDAIRHNDDFFMIASSFNHTPGIPVLHSKNLVDWKIINYVYDKIPFDRFKDVIHGAGAWAPSIRYHNGLFYAIIPFIDEGIYISCTKDPFGKWSDLWCLIPGSGIEDPCPIWIGDKCYLAVGFAKSRMGFNSCLGLYEVSPDLKEKLSDYTIIYDGHNDNPTIEGPKFYQRNGYIYIMAPAGSVKTGWQTCLRSKNVYGPYETKIVLMQGDAKINGPHQGALVDVDDNGNFAFIHFQDKDCYGRITHLQPVKWVNDWPLCGLVRDELLPGTPVIEGDYPVNIKTSDKIDFNDDFKDSISLVWQTPANQNEDWFKADEGLFANCYYHNEASKLALNLQPNLLLQKLPYLSFKASVKLDAMFLEEEDECGLVLMGMDYAYVSIKVVNKVKHLIISQGSFNKNDVILIDKEYNKNSVSLGIIYSEPNKYQFVVDGVTIENVFTAKPGRWIGSKIGIFARGIKNPSGYGIFENFRLIES